ncbi:hypothetical protein KO528_17350 [Saccharophagus degradans]|uniref:hypothetical protein n=1 Tax=Saccharophagus degradans TaxID=86304 RepID=UPI001C0A5D9A|nr:hypothetical protein [Saccharophagus degradans]MBU2987136.1 hypothetical protein [Saccharophagus degradans]
MNKIIIVSICLILCSCATGYQKYSWAGGYKDKDLGDGVHLVEYFGNGTHTPATVEMYWLQRANEICSNGFEVIEGEDGANEGAAFSGGAMSIAHPWKKAKIKCN